MTKEKVERKVNGWRAKGFRITSSNGICATCQGKLKEHKRCESCTILLHIKGNYCETCI